MATDFYIPNLGENVKEVTIVNWLVEDGAKVNVDDEILEVETDKAVVPLPANGQGYLHIGPFKAGDAVPVLTVVATIGDKDESFAPGRKVASEPEAAAETQAAEPTASTIQTTATGLESRPKATPVAQKMAADLGIDLAAINGSGDQGKITKEDILQAVSAPEDFKEALATPPEETPEPALPGEPTPPTVAPAVSPPATSGGEVLQRIPLKGIRGVIARRMAESVHTTARVTLTTEVDATELVALREELKAKYTAEWGFAPGYNDLLAVMVATGLREFPYMNARISPEGDAIEYLNPINIGMAVDTERGLLVTVIRDADKKGLRQFGAEFRQLVNRAREGKSKPEDLSGGTFTITSLGIYRVDAFTPVINLPEAAILGIGRIKPKPVVKDNEIVIRQMVALSLVFDHRLTDGAPAARFLDYICELVEDPSLLFVTRR